MNIHEELARIQRELKVPKGKYSEFGDFNFRSCDDILSAVKPHLNGCYLTLTDKVEHVGDFNYFVGRATLSLPDIDGGNEARIFSQGQVYAEGWAQELKGHKKMNEPQMSGASSSYARKRALEGLLALDNTDDVDVLGKGSDSSVPPAVLQRYNELMKEVDSMTTATADAVRTSCENARKVLPKGELLENMEKALANAEDRLEA